MNNIAVIYKSKYGTTKQYAEWIAQELDAALLEKSTVNPSQLASFDVVIFGGGLYAGKIDGVKLVAKTPCKSLVVFTVGLADPAITDYSRILNTSFSKELLSKTKIFHLQGGIDYEKLGFIHKTMMFMVKKFRVDRKRSEERTDEDRAFLETYGGKFDFVNRSAIKPLVDYVRKTCQI